MTSSLSEYRKAAESATRTAGLRVVAAKVSRLNGEIVVEITVGPHDKESNAYAFITTLAGLLQNQHERTTDYEQWCFSCPGNSNQGCCFKIAPVDYYERYGDTDFDPYPYFQLPEDLGFRHQAGATFFYSGNEEDGRMVLIRLGLKEYF
jgi:hypothetical protein